MKYGTITAKGQTTVPKDVRDKLKLKPGDKVYWIVENGKAVLRPKNGSIMDLAGMFYDPNRKPMTIEELQEAIGDAVAEGAMGDLTRR
jgi:antitoxin PrlF